MNVDYLEKLENPFRSFSFDTVLSLSQAQSTWRHAIRVLSFRGCQLWRSEGNNTKEQSIEAIVRYELSLCISMD